MEGARGPTLLKGGSATLAQLIDIMCIGYLWKVTGSTDANFHTQCMSPSHRHPPHFRELAPPNIFSFLLHWNLFLEILYQD